jgi:hypothetical protein
LSCVRQAAWRPRAIEAAATAVSGTASIVARPDLPKELADVLSVFVRHVRAALSRAVD